MKKYEYVEINYTAKGVVFLCTDKHKEIINGYAKKWVSLCRVRADRS